MHETRWIKKTERSALALRSDEYRAQWQQMAADTETIARIRQRIEELEGA
jgi:hypothetical protein